MAIRLICGDGCGARLPKGYFEKSVFKNPEIAGATSYTLKCKARSSVVNAFLDWMDGVSDEIAITEDNFDQLRCLCNELGFTGLNKQLHAFLGETENDVLNLKGFLLLKERVTRHDKRLSEIQRLLSELLSWKQKAESETRQIKSVERKVDEVARLCEERALESSQKMERALIEYARRSDLSELARNVALLKENESSSHLRPARSLEVIDSKFSCLPPLKQDGNASLNLRRDFVCNESNKLDGIIAYLTRECGGNVHEKGVVNVTSSSAYYNSHTHNDHPPKNAADLGTDILFGTYDKENSWICYDFKDRRVIPTSYTVRSQKGHDGWDHPKSWVIEVSNDGSEGSWRTIDRRDDNDDLNHWRVTVTFKISNVPRESFRFFRLRLTGPNHKGNHSLWLCALEIFGTLCDK